MARFTVDLSEANNFDPIPSGVYPVVVVETEVLDGSAGPYAKIVLEVLDGEFAKRKLFTNLSSSKKSAFKLQEALIAWGMNPDDPALASTAYDFDPDDYLGVECQAAVSQEPYEGRMTNRVTALLPPKGKPTAAPGPKTFSQGNSSSTPARPRIR